MVVRTGPFLKTCFKSKLLDFFQLVDVLLGRRVPHIFKSRSYIGSIQLQQSV